MAVTASIGDKGGWRSSLSCLSSIPVGRCYPWWRVWSVRTWLRSASRSQLMCSYKRFGMWFTLSLFGPFSVAKKCTFKNFVFQQSFKFLQNFKVFWNWNFENFGLEEITEIVELMKRFPMSIWLQKSATIQTSTSLVKFEDRRFCRSQLANHMPSLL